VISIRSLFIAVALSCGLAGCMSIEPAGMHPADRAVQAAPSAPAPGRGETIRVLVLKNALSIDARGAGARDMHIYRSAPGRVSVNGRTRRLPLRLRPRDGGGVVYLGGRPYRGVVEIRDAHDGSASLDVIDELDLEAYLVGLINNEISSGWPAEAVKAQAVVARTYALYKKKRRPPGGPFDLEGSVMGQVYSGAGSEDERALGLVMETAGEVLYYDGSPALTVYHSNAGGMTAASEEVWKSSYAYLRSVPSPYDRDDPRYDWEFSLGAASLRKALNRAGIRAALPVRVRIARRTRSGRVARAVVTDARGRRFALTGAEMRRAVGYSNLRSTIFAVTRKGGLFVFSGRGSGHGVGLSQWGARGMAQDGYSYTEILAHYYPGTRLMRIRRR